MHIASIGIDLGKTTFHLVALGERSKVRLRKKFSRSQLLAYSANLPASLIGLEACAGAHFIGAVLREQGHEVRLIPAHFVKPYRKSNKNDFLDAEAIAEAVSKQNMRFVSIKTPEQLDWQAMHRVRDRLVQRRTALINEIRGFLLERSVTFAAGPIHLRKNLPGVIEDAAQNLSPRLRWLLDRMWQEWKQIETDVEVISEEIERISKDDARCRQLRQIPGFGPLVSTATVAAIGNGTAFRRGRDFAVWMGVMPRQHSTGASRSCAASASGATLSAPYADPRCVRRVVSHQVQHRGIGTVGAPAESASSTQQSDCRHRQQTGPHLLGRVVQR
jgi:transposase